MKEVTRPSLSLPRELLYRLCPPRNVCFTEEMRTKLAQCGINTSIFNPLFLGVGANHHVFQLNDKEVLKLPTALSFATMTIGPEEERASYNQARKYFTDKYIPKTTVFENINTGFYCVVQDKVEGNVLTTQSLQRQNKLQDQLTEIITMNQHFYGNECRTLDLVGLNGFLSMLERQRKKIPIFSNNNQAFLLSNFLVNQEGNIKIIDFESFDLGHKVGFSKWHFNWLRVEINRLLMLHYFGLDILGQTPAII